MGDHTVGGRERSASQVTMDTVTSTTEDSDLGTFGVTLLEPEPMLSRKSSSWNMRTTGDTGPTDSEVEHLQSHECLRVSSVRPHQSSCPLITHRTSAVTTSLHQAPATHTRSDMSRCLHPCVCAVSIGCV